MNERTTKPNDMDMLRYRDQHRNSRHTIPICEKRKPSESSSNYASRPAVWVASGSIASSLLLPPTYQGKFKKHAIRWPCCGHGWGLELLIPPFSSLASALEIENENDATYLSAFESCDKPLHLWVWGPEMLAGEMCLRIQQIQ